MNFADGDFETNQESLELDETKDTHESLFNKLKREQSGSLNSQFCLSVSMQDGKVLYTTSTLTDVLGFPCDMWIGRSFIDFVHQKDRIAFANHITVGRYFSQRKVSLTFLKFFFKNWKLGSNT